MITRISGIVLSFVVGFLITQIYVTSSRADRELELCRFETNTQKFKVDSIKDEMFILETELTRYRIALEMLEDENPKAASEFNKHLSMIE